jgi:hypothetical protein
MGDISPLFSNLRYEDFRGLNDKIIVATDGHSNLEDATSSLKSNDWSVGKLQGNSPIGIVNGEMTIEKWRNLSPEDKETLDGVIIKDELGKFLIIFFKFPDF